MVFLSGIFSNWNHLKNNNIVAGRRTRKFIVLNSLGKLLLKKVEKPDSITVISKDSTFIAQSTKEVKNETAVISPVSSKKNISTARNPRNPAL